jgi:hypothetical protein
LRLIDFIGVKHKLNYKEKRNNKCNFPNNF